MKPIAGTSIPETKTSQRANTDVCGEKKGLRQ